MDNNFSIDNKYGLSYNCRMNLHRSPNYKKHEHHKMTIRDGYKPDLYRLECAECEKKNFIMWLNKDQANLVWEMLDDSR